MSITKISVDISVFANSDNIKRVSVFLGDSICKPRMCTPYVLSGSL